jgi:hypothetical protein
MADARGHPFAERQRIRAATGIMTRTRKIIHSAPVGTSGLCRRAGDAVHASHVWRSDGALHSASSRWCQHRPGGGPARILAPGGGGLC